MKRYFAYGSNMSRARLEARTGRVIHHGYAVLSGYFHAFTHHGRDGSGKGNIVVAGEHEVHGVLYELGDEQVEALASYEGGYEVIDIEVQLVGAGQVHSAYTYMDHRPTGRLAPRKDYIAHYLQGMRENELPQFYIDAILAHIDQ